MLRTDDSGRRTISRRADIKKPASQPGGRPAPHVPHDTAEAEVGKPEGLSGSQTGVASITRVGASGRRGKGTGNATDGEVRSEVRRATQSGLLFLSLNAAFSTGPAGKARLRRESALEILPVNNYLIFPSSFLKLEFIFSSSPIKRLGVFVVSK